MASTYSTRARFELQADGENETTWGQKEVTNHELTDEALYGYLAKSCAGGSDVTLTASNAASDEVRQRMIKCTGALTGNINVIVPAVEGFWNFWNATSGSYTLTVKTSGGTGIAIPQGGACDLFCDGTNVERATTLDGLGIDSFTGDVGITGDLTLTGAAGITGDLTVSDTTADALEGPLVDLHRDSASPANDDILGAVVFSGEDDGSNKTTYGKIKGAATDVTDASEDGEIHFDTMVGGTLSTAMKVGAGLYMDGATGGDQGADTVNASNYYLDGAQLTDDIVVKVTDDSEALVAGTAAITFRMPFAMTVTEVRASLVTAQSSGDILTIDINESGSTILSTKLTVDNGEETSTTAAAAAVISDSALADDAEITIDIDQIGDGTAEGLQVSLKGTRA